MSLNTNLYRLAKHQRETNFSGRKEVKRTFYHTEISPAVIIVLDLSGRFETAFIPEEKMTVITPCTLESLSRSNGNFDPHSLHDKLKYLTPKSKVSKEYGGYNKYKENLERWYRQSGMPELLSLIMYLDNGSILDDIREFIEKKTANGSTSIDFDTFVAFEFDDSGRIVLPWFDERFIDSYISCYDKELSQKGSSSICYVTGSRGRQSYRFPKGFHLKKHGEDMVGNVKYISSKDTLGTVWGGLFRSQREVVGLCDKAVYYISWALDYIFRYCSTDFNGVYYALVPVDFDLPIKVGLSYQEFASIFDIDSSKWESFEILRKTILEKVPNTGTMIFLSAKVQSKGRITITGYQEYHNREIREALENIIHWYKQTSLVLNVKYFKPIEGMPEQPEREVQKKNSQEYSEESIKVLDSTTESFTFLINYLYHLSRNGSVNTFYNSADDEVFHDLLNCQLTGKELSEDIRKQMVCLIESGFWVNPKSVRFKQIDTLCALIRFDTGMDWMGYPCEAEKFYFGRLLGLLDFVDPMFVKKKTSTYIQREFFALSGASISELQIRFAAMITSKGKKMKRHLELQMMDLLPDAVLDSCTEDLYQRIIGYQYEIKILEGRKWKN